MYAFFIEKRISTNAELEFIMLKGHRKLCVSSIEEEEKVKRCQVYLLNFDGYVCLLLRK